MFQGHLKDVQGGCYQRGTHGVSALALASALAVKFEEELKVLKF